MIENGKYYVITSDSWFFAPDGESYKAVWGKCVLKKTEDVFGFTPLRPSTNFFLIVGTEENHVIIAGCQVHYAVRCADKPKDHRFNKTYIDKDNGVEYNQTRIYLTE